ncbi:AMP-binding protein [Streptomyces sp. NPDC020875]|uniref:AMP-binding protein n=1 Tax=Streptomyces sp. NPDC020875 TaxID=3154898 RepID=UPI0034033897
MTERTLGRIVAGPPTGGGRIAFASLLGTETMPLTELYRRSGLVARWLRDEHGIRPGDRIGILAANGPAWILLDLAALRLGARTAGFEPGKFTPGAGLVDTYDLTLLATDRPEAAGLPGVLPTAEVTAVAEGPGDGSGEAGPPPVVWAPEDVTTIKFTSGSTGEPKGLGATAGSVDSSLRAVQQIFGHGPGDDLFVFLPLSLLQQRYWVYSALLHGHDVTISTYEAAFAALRRVRPTVVMGVPAFFETAKRQIETRLRRDRGTPDPGAAARAVFGDRIRYLWTGSAPASPDMVRFLTDAGLPVYEGYGLNETCIVTKNHPGANRPGSVGRALPGKEILIGDDGVVSVRSDHPVNDHYAYAAPGDSERMFRPGGIVRTGDLGRLDEDGFLYILGRADDVIVLDNGKKVVVRPVEEALRADPSIAECVVFCPGQTDLVAVVSPAAVPADSEAIAAHLKRTNERLAADERISRVVVADEPFSIENGLLTSQFKPKRARILELHHTAVHDPTEGIHAS